MSRVLRISAFLLVIAMLTGGCAKKHKVGSEELLDVKEQKQAERLGEILKSPEPTAAGESPGALGAKPTTAPPDQQPKQQLVELNLIGSHPFYEVDGQGGQNMQISAGATVRVTNKDDKTRRFQTSNGPYDTGNLAPGETKEFVASVKGRFQVEDKNVPFATGTLEVI